MATPSQSVGWPEFFQAISDYLASTGIFGPGSTFWAIDPDSVLQWPTGPSPFGLIVPGAMNNDGIDEGGGRFEKLWIASISIHIVVNNVLDSAFRDTAVVTSDDSLVGPYELVHRVIDKMEQEFIQTVNGNYAMVEKARALQIGELHRFKETNAYVSIPIQFEMSILEALPSTMIPDATPPDWPPPEE